MKGKRDLSHLDAYDKTPAMAFVQVKQPTRNQKRRLGFSFNPDSPKRKYHIYMRSQRWKTFRDKIFSARGRICERCGGVNGPFEVHHIDYARLGNEDPQDVKIWELYT